MPECCVEVGSDQSIQHCIPQELKPLWQAVSRGKEAGGIVRDLDWLRMADVQAHRQMPRPAPASQPASQQQAAPTW